MTRYFITAWCDRPFFARCEVEADTPEEALADARNAIHEAPAKECDDTYEWDEWRVDTADTDAVLIHRDEPARLRAVADNLLLACRMVVDRWEHGNLAEAARACRAAVTEATGEGSKEDREPIVIEVRGGAVQDVRNVPPGCAYRIVDHGNREEHAIPAEPAQPPLPPDPEGMNAARAAWAGRAVRTFQDATGTRCATCSPAWPTGPISKAMTSRRRCAAPAIITRPRRSGMAGDSRPRPFEGRTSRGRPHNRGTNHRWTRLATICY